MADIERVRDNSTVPPRIDTAPSVATPKTVDANVAAVTTSTDDRLDLAVNNALAAVHDIEVPKVITVDLLIIYLTSTAVKLANLGGKIADEVLKSQRSQIEEENQKRISEISKNFAMIHKAEKKQKLINAVTLVAGFLSAIASGATLGAASGPAALATAAFATVGAATAIGSSIFEMTAHTDKMDPKKLKAIRTIFMVAQIVCALLSIAAALKAASSAGAKAGAKLAEGGMKSSADAGKALDAALQTAVTNCIEEASEETFKTTAKQVIKTAAEKATRQIADIAEIAGDDAVSATCKTATKKVCDQIVHDVTEEVAKRTGTAITREIAEEIAKQVTEQVGKRVMTDIAEEAGSTAAKQAVRRVSETVLRDVSAQVVKESGDAAAIRLLCDKVARAASLAGAGTRVVGAGEQIDLGITDIKIGRTKRDIANIEADLELFEELNHKTMDWLARVGEVYMKSQRTITEIANDMNSAKSSAIGALSGPGANAS
ncbi:MAG: hypothetical protein AAF713_02715 [Pseudomonadota bacterium]